MDKYAVVSEGCSGGDRRDELCSGEYPGPSPVPTNPAQEPLANVKS